MQDNTYGTFVNIYGRYWFSEMNKTPITEPVTAGK